MMYTSRLNFALERVIINLVEAPLGPSMTNNNRGRHS
jgi:hypothetical protein